MQTLPILGAMLFSLVISIASGFYLGFRYRTAQARWAGAAVFGEALALGFYVLQWSVLSPQVSQLFYLFQVAGYSLFCAFWLFYLFVFTRRAGWIKPRVFLLSTALPLACWLMILVGWTPGPVVDPSARAIDGLLYYSFMANGLPGMAFTLYGFGTAFFSLFILIRFSSVSNSLARRLVLPFLLAVIVMLVVGVLELTGVNPMHPISLHQFTFSGIGFFSLWIVVDLRLRSGVSSARETVIDQMQDGVLILDENRRIVEINPVAQQLLGVDGKPALRQPLSRLWPAGDALLSAHGGAEPALGEAAFHVNGADLTYHVNLSRMLDAYREPIGHVIVLRNITELDIFEKALNERASELERANGFLASLAQVNSSLQTATDPASIYAILAGELEKMKLGFFITRLDPETNLLQYSYISSYAQLIHQVEKVLGFKAAGFLLDRQQFASVYEILEKDTIRYTQFNPSTVVEIPGKPTRAALEQGLRLIGLRAGMAVMMLPLKTGDRRLGLMGVWGGDLRETDIYPFQVFANQVAHLMERAILYEVEIERAAELERVNSLIMALTRVAAVVGSRFNSALVLDTLGQELSKFGVSCAVVRFDEAGETAFIKYVSFPNEIMARIERLTGLQYRNHPIPKRFWPGERIFTQQRPIWFSNSYETIRQMLPAVPGSVSKQVFRLLKFEEDIHLCMVPLIVEDRTIGAMPIWGPNLKPSDGMILSVFASQVAGSIRNIADYENEVERRDELERSNAMILALSNVAARLDSTSNLAQVYETLGSELRKIRVSCIVGTLNPEKTSLKLEYISIMETLTSLLEKVSFLSPKELVVPRTLWPTDKAVTEKAPVWDTDLVGSASRMYPAIPEVIAAKVLEGAGIGRDDPVCHLPMISEEEVVGILSVWGPDLRQADIPGLSVFANQLAAALRNAQLYNRAQKEITERIQGEGRILEALGEKEVLLKEVHHRVKNNLQVISSLLNLHAAQITDTVTIDALRESQNRIRSMALIHEKLYQSSDLTQVDFAGYLGSLVNSLAQTYRKKTARIAVKVEAEKIDLNIDTAIPCGLIVNELVSNSLKYAYPDDASGVIEVRCGRSGNERYFLNVRDQGVGLPAGLDIDESPSLGLKLVASLVRQIEGELTICGDDGACFDITWPSKG